jgi:deoxyadenosine/deoxycytidine kinase
MLIIEGVVGVGKSSLMNILAEEGYTPFREPVLDNPILDKFYTDRKRYAFPLQVYFLTKRFEHLQTAALIDNAVMDRSIYGDGIFAAMHHDTGTMDSDEYGIYAELYATLMASVQRPTLVVYLRCSVDTAMARIHKRGRSYEQAVERDYWEKLHAKYETLFEHYIGSKLLVLNVDHLDFEANEDDRAYVLLRIHEALQETA